VACQQVLAQALVLLAARQALVLASSQVQEPVLVLVLVQTEPIDRVPRIEAWRSKR